jgi:ATP-dependent Clp protease ATP-binding subunit ClpA
MALHIHIQPLNDGIDLVDEAASALRIAQESKPDELEALDRDIITLQVFHHAAML